MKYLIVVAHPDDEVLGAGATIHKLVEQGNQVAICTMANHAAARANLSDTLAQDQQEAFRIMNVDRLCGRLSKHQDEHSAPSGTGSVYRGLH